MSTTPTAAPRPRLNRRAWALLLRSVAGAALLTASTAVAALLSLMFGTDEVPARALGLFGSLYVETTRASSGAVDVSMGVANPTALLVIFALCLTALALTQVIYQALTQYRLDLIEARAST